MGKMMVADFNRSIFTNSRSASIKRDVYGIPAVTVPQALKCLLDKFTFIKKSDIYSLGVILWEISSGYIPFKDLPNPGIILHILQGERETL
jgi:serine/threonine protein kinase